MQPVADATMVLRPSNWCTKRTAKGLGAALAGAVARDEAIVLGEQAERRRRITLPWCYSLNPMKAG